MIPENSGIFILLTWQMDRGDFYKITYIVAIL
jgi:hypothetical protein